MSPSHRARRLAIRLAAITAVAATLSACSEGTGPSDGLPTPITELPRALTALEQQAIRASNDFGLSLLREVAASAPDSNVVLSPLSASVALGMAYAGAEGATADSMRLALGWGTTSRADILAGYRELPAMLAQLDPKVEFRSANSLWVRNNFPVLPSYTQEMEQVFSAQVRTGDFGPTTVAEMNAWASQQTNGRIPTVVESLDPLLMATLMNALYFKGSWRDRFETTRTRSVPFTTRAGARPSVPTMHRTDDMTYGRVRGAQVVELPYGNTAFVMTVVLPAEGSTPQAWLDGLDAPTLAAGLATLREADVDLALPRFRLSLGFDLVPSLTTMGMGRAFSPRTADFSRIGPGDLYISFVKQDVFIDVNEEGTEAAAVTSVGVGVTSAPQREVMHVDRPFLFFIRERLSGTILFTGIVEQPRT
jgi:serpin B